MKKIPILISATAFIASVTMSSGAIVIMNPSFELPDINDGGALQGGAQDWPGGSNTFLVDNGPGQNAYFAGPVPDGQQALSLNNTFITQQLNDTISGPVLTSTVAQTFEFTFFAARRSGASGSGTGTFTTLIQAYDGANYLGDLASQKYNLLSNDNDSSTIDLNLGVGEWSGQINLSLTAAANQFVGSNIRIVFAAGGGFGDSSGNLEPSIDNVRVVPEPTSIILGALGFLGFLRRRR